MADSATKQVRTGRNWQRTILITALLLSAVVVGASGQEHQEGYAGSGICFSCHLDFAKEWALLTHSQALLAPGRPASETGCEACHGPALKHTAGLREQIVQFDQLSAAAQSQVCLKCHQGKVDGERWSGGPHAKADLSCMQCHDVHHGVPNPHLLRKPVSDTCLGCHAKIPDLATQGQHHRLAAAADYPDVNVTKGEIACTQCHDPHTDNPDRLLKGPRADVCHTCHKSGGPEPADHEAEGWVASEGHPRQLTSKATYCSQCHTSGDCMTCHESFAPSSHSDGWPSRHQPEGKAKPPLCYLCHGSDYAGKEACADCHAGVRTEQGKLRPASHGAENWILAQGHPIAAAAKPGNCGACHTPESCMQCHDGFSPPSHDSQWLPKHPEPGKKQGDFCALCHSAAYAGQKLCSDCHRGTKTQEGKLRPASHDQEGWLTSDGHPKQARAGAVSCQVCHVKADCMSCHEAFPPSDHTGDFATGHPGQGKQARPFCLLCHGQDFAGTTLCSTCHSSDTQPRPLSHSVSRKVGGKSSN